MFKKNTLKEVLTLAIPAVFEMILYMMIWVFDTMMVGKYGGNIAVSSVGISSEIMYTFVNIFIAVGISVGITSLVARKVGANELNKAEEYASLGFALGFIVALIVSILLFIFAKDILILAGAKGEVVSLGNMFIRIASFSIFFSMLSSMLNAVMRGFGNTITPLIISILINCVNILLDYVLIFGKLGFKSLGVKGSAIATTIAQAVGLIACIIYMKYKSKIKIRFNYITKINVSEIKNIIKLSVPASMQEGAFDITRLLCTFMIIHLGTIPFAANQIATTIESISFMPGWGFSVAATTLVGHKIGKGNHKEAKEYAFTCALLGALLMSCCSVLFLLFPNFLINLFITSSEAEVIKTGARCLMIASIEQPFMAVSMILGGALKGSGDTKTPFIVSVITGCFIRLPLMYYFIYKLMLPVNYVWWITALQWFIDGTALFFIFIKKFNVNSSQKPIHEYK